MNDENTDTLEEFIRVVRKRRGEVVMQVGVVHWAGPHTPTIEWTTVRSWPSEPGQAEIDIEKARTLADRRYFRLCEMCRERRNAGHMHSDDVCQGCAERHLGVVH